MLMIFLGIYLFKYQLFFVIEADDQINCLITNTMSQKSAHFPLEENVSVKNLTLTYLTQISINIQKKFFNSWLEYT